MSESAHRLLRVLTLLQHGRRRTAAELAGALGVTPRTVRRDVARLRGLGYPITGDLGPGGGYGMLRRGLPPLVLDMEEAVTALLALRGVSGDIAESAGLKLQHALPAGLRAVADTLRTHTTDLRLGQMVGSPPRPVAPAALTLLAGVCRDRLRVTCRQGTLEPHHLVRAMDRWYVVTYVVDTAAWAVLEVDRLGDLSLDGGAATGPLFTGDAAALVAAHVCRRVRTVEATVRVHAPAEAVARWVQPAWGTVMVETPDTTIVECGAASWAGMARWLLLTEADITVLAPSALRRAFGELAAVAGRAAREP